MKLVMSTAVAAVVLTALATGLAEAQKKDCVKARRACRTEVMGAMSYMDYWVNRTPESITVKITECMRVRGCPYDNTR